MLSMASVKQNNNNKQTNKTKQKQQIYVCTFWNFQKNKQKGLCGGVMSIVEGRAKTTTSFVCLSRLAGSSIFAVFHHKHSIKIKKIKIKKSESESELEHENETNANRNSSIHPKLELKFWKIYLKENS